ncbi:MAG: stage II sporulation protein M [Chitinophagales bacterium]
MKEPAFIKKNAKKWQHFEAILDSKIQVSPDEQAELFVEITDDLAYSQTFFPKSKITRYLNGLAAKIHQFIYKNKKEDSNRLVTFWRYELPFLFYQSHKHLLYAFLIFAVAICIGVLSSAKDETFVRLILGDGYVNMTLHNINQGDPMAVYKKTQEMDMFLGITINNIRVSFMAFALGIVFSLGTAYILFVNGVMVGAFQYLFYKHGLFWTSFLTIWIHGTLEISAIVIAGCAGFVMGNSLLFPKTYSRRESLKRGAKQGLKIIIGLVPIFITAGFLESFVTRKTEWPDIIQLLIILVSLAIIIVYFVIYPIYLNKNANNEMRKIIEGV